MSDALSLSSRCEAILFASARAWQRRKLAEACEALTDDIDLALKELSLGLDEAGSALQLVEHGQEIELVTRGEYASLLRHVFTQDAAGELSRPSLETLAILAYRGPLTRPELEQIRGVQCAMILRNLSLRGLVEIGTEERLGQATYQVTLDFLKHFGLPSLDQLPDYGSLHHVAAVEQLLHEVQEEAADPALTRPNSSTEVS